MTYPIGTVGAVPGTHKNVLNFSYSQKIKMNIIVMMIVNSDGSSIDDTCSCTNEVVKKLMLFLSGGRNPQKTKNAHGP